MGYQELYVILQQNSFELFGLLPKFNLTKDKPQITARYYQQQKIYHPDNFVYGESSKLTIEQGTSLSTLILQVSSHLNHAYYVLMHDLPRAMELLKLYGIELDLTQDTSLPAAVIDRQMEVYEYIDEARISYKCSADIGVFTKRLEQIRVEVQADIDAVFERLDYSFEQHILDQAVLFTKQLSCYSKMLGYINHEIDELYTQTT